MKIKYSIIYKTKMTVAIDFVGTNLESGTKTYNINFCKYLSEKK